MVFNYSVGKQLSIFKDKEDFKKKILIIGVIFNLSLLGYFKYSDFFIDNFNTLFHTSVPLLHLLLPLAISFYTFQQIAYLIDSYRGETREYDFLNYAVFVTFFPQLIAGPIVHHSEMMPQFAKMRNKVINYHNIALGLFIFSLGLFKKVAIADTFAIWATRGFDVAENLNMIEGWLTSLSYTFQLYFDFSGYTDMAIGLALLFNIKLPINFNSPYKSSSIQEFWQRWHITLSRFLKDYLYIPLGGNRRGDIRTYSNLFLTFLLGGIWHGAGWTFVLWGVLHGIALVIHRVWKELGLKMNYLLGWFLTFNFINISWVFFRAKEFDDAIKVLDGMFFGDIILPIQLENRLNFLAQYGISFGSWLRGVGADIYIFIWIFIAFIVVLLFKNSMELKNNFKPNFIYMISTILFFLTIFLMYRESEFIYFNF
jgi:D-alanyl-lipoteichoic acid acyltransferase DltB (MBOAT superfamily)